MLPHATNLFQFIELVVSKDRYKVEGKNGGRFVIATVTSLFLCRRSGCLVTKGMLDSGRSAAAEDGLLSDFEQSCGSPEKEPLAKEVLAIVVASVPFSGKLGERQYICSWKCVL